MTHSESPENKAKTRQIPWSEIEPGLETLGAVEGGNSDAKRGFVTIDGEKVFVKIGVNEHTKGWANKEIRAYDFLAENSYPYIPEVLSTNPDQTGFALEAFLAENGWDWSDTWSKERLSATLAATDALAAIKPEAKHLELLKPVITDNDNGWITLAATPELQEALSTKLANINETDLVAELKYHLDRSLEFKVRHDTIVHDDVRADNSPWNQSTGEVKLVDWNWIELGDRRIDVASMLVHIQNSGLNVIPDFAYRLDPEALHWLAGFWLKNASTPMWEGGPEKLRDTQLKAGLTALRLASQCKLK